MSESPGTRARRSSTLVHPPSVICSDNHDAARPRRVDAGRTIGRCCGASCSHNSHSRRQRRESAEQMRRDDLRPELQRDGPQPNAACTMTSSSNASGSRTDARVRATDSERRQSPESASRACPRSSGAPSPATPCAPRPARAESARPRSRPRAPRPGTDEKTVAAGPVGTTESRIHQTRVGAEHDDGECEHDTDCASRRNVATATTRVRPTVDRASANLRHLQQLLQILEHRFARIAVRIAQHDIAERVHDVDTGVAARRSPTEASRASGSATAIAVDLDVAPSSTRPRFTRDWHRD